MKAKVVSVLLCMAMVTTMAVGCGSSSDSSESTDSSKKESTEAKEFLKAMEEKGIQIRK